jgi:AbiV family abortive infection protein
MPVTAQSLLEGAAYALDQCGRLLHAANVLNKDDDYATSVALALAAWEELGRWTILLDLRREVLDGKKQYTAQQVREACDNHVSKQEAGMKSTVMRADGESGLKKLLQARMNAKPGTKEWNEANEQIEKLDRQKQRRTPDERHKQRMAALYVDAVSETQWNRPSTKISAKQACEILTDAANDYSLASDRYTNLTIMKATNSELGDALEAWKDRPTLPLAEHPAFVS